MAYKTYKRTNGNKHKKHPSKQKTQKGNKRGTPKTNVFSRAFRIGKSREELKQQLRNFIIRYIELKTRAYPTVSPEKAKSDVAKSLKLEENLSPVGLTIEQLDYRTRKMRKKLLDLRLRIDKKLATQE